MVNDYPPSTATPSTTKEKGEAVQRDKKWTDGRDEKRRLTTRRAPTTKDEAVFTPKSPGVSTIDSKKQKNETSVASGGTCRVVALRYGVNKPVVVTR